MFALGSVWPSASTTWSTETSATCRIALNVLFFLTPITYPLTLVPEDLHGIPLRRIFEMNSLDRFVESRATSSTSAHAHGVHRCLHSRSSRWSAFS